MAVTAAAIAVYFVNNFIVRAPIYVCVLVNLCLQPDHSQVVLKSFIEIVNKMYTMKNNKSTNVI
ncbi:hypothetical protein GCM10011274_05240 [Paraglaciecola chathamensis]|uniref:Uncharacterized protein n=1 Tax=Paraglaciecola chathamensis TaxID=368405 RepID=A0A8H9LV24_9ALTE|nr:hypothetical protein GCM10011274_05240 [Paraglaciecola oceanifecundans]